VLLPWPFVGTEALAAGAVTNHGLRTAYVAVHRNVYVPRGARPDAVDKAVAAWLWSRRLGVLAGTSAAVLHGTRWIDADLPAELNRAGRDKVDGIVLHSDVLADEEVCRRHGMPVTTAARTAFDIGRVPGLETAVIRIDALRRATGLGVDSIHVIAERHRGGRGIRQLRRVLELSDPGAESPQETRTRLVLTSAGLRPTHTQLEVRDQFGRFVARLDMGWPDALVAVEFDGAQHWTDPRQRSRDIDRIAELEELNWIVVRVSGEMLRHRPLVVVQRVRAALRERGLVVAETA
jgi:very-short-patch-repair endonuclease